MLRDALQWLKDTVKSGELVQQMTYHGDQHFTDRTLYKVPPRPVPQPDRVAVRSLAGLVNYIDADPDLASEQPGLFLVVAGPALVQLYTGVQGETEERKLYAEAIPLLPEGMGFGYYHGLEEFVIQLRTRFAPSAGRDELVTFLGRVSNDAQVETTDDGFTQRVTTTKGITLKGKDTAPQSVLLAPYRTFHEVEQPTSEFVVRLRDGGGVQAAIFEADGGAWEGDARERIADYLRENQDLPVLA